jgi:hypothetical protein
MPAVAIRIARLSLWVSLALSAGVASADVWRWVDSTGRIHYSDVPVDGAVRIKSATTRRPESVGGGVPGASGGPAAQPTLASNAVAIKERVQTEQASRDVQNDVLKKRAEQCKAATERYDRAIAARRLFREGKAGERVYLTDAEIAQSRMEARRDRDTACNPAGP